eukprot:1088596-Rhodomonas_salina.2
MVPGLTVSAEARALPLAAALAPDALHSSTTPTMSLASPRWICKRFIAPGWLHPRVCTQITCESETNPDFSTVCTRNAGACLRFRRRQDVTCICSSNPPRAVLTYGYASFAQGNTTNSTTSASLIAAAPFPHTRLCPPAFQSLTWHSLPQ